MDLIISGMALSLQWTPSIRQAEYCLSGRYQPLPAMVEHPGEVIQKALQDIPGKSAIQLVHIHLGPETEFGHYGSLLEDQFLSVDRVVPVSPQLSQILDQAARLLNRLNKVVVISQTTNSGTAAIVLSHPEAEAGSCARMYSWPPEEGKKSQIDYIGLAASPDAAQLTLLDQIASGSLESHPIALGSFNAPRPKEEALPVFIQTVLAIQNRIIPAWFEGHAAPPADHAAQDLRVPSRSRPWLPGGPGFKRRALFAQLSQGESAWEVVCLEEISRPADHIQTRTIPGKDPFLFPISGNQAQEMIAQLESLEEQLSRPGSLKMIAENAYTKYSQNKGRLHCCLIGEDRESLFKEISHGKKGIATALESGQPWSSPAGSYFTPQPLGSSQIAFVYPGAFNSYPGMAQDLFFAFPGLMDAAQKLIPDLRHSLAEEFLYLQQDRGVLENKGQAEFYEHPSQLIESGISISVLYTLLLKEVFQIGPDAALGYSLGEISMLWANRVWQNAQDSSDRWKNSQLYTDQLAGEMKIVREYWKNEVLPADFWDSYILKADPQQVQEVCDQEPLAFLTIRNTPGEVVIAGEKEACRRIISRLGCRALPMPFNTAIHNPAVAASYQVFLELYSNPTTPQDGIRFYSAADYQVLELSEDNLAQKMAKMTTSPIDFARLVSQVYDSGVRIFIEVGPQKTCSRWIENILAGKPHAVIPINKKYQDDFLGILKVISLLVSHGVELDLDPLYHPSDAVPSVTPAKVNSGQAKQSAPSTKLNNRSASPAKIQALNAAYFQNLNLLSQGMVRVHQSYLNEQHKITKSILKTIALQKGLPLPTTRPQTGEALFSRSQIRAFTIGDPQECFGDLFQGFRGQRIPRLPNGPLQFMDRVIQTDSQLGEIRPGSRLVSEFDIPADGWFSDGQVDALPHVALMEIALQPCGFLSAYMGSILGREGQDLYFRNLDGEATLLKHPIDTEQPITNQVELLSSSSLGDVIIQKYRFELSQGGRPFFNGSSSFGYFTPQMLKNQNGLDGEQANSPWQEQYPGAGSWTDFPRTAIPLNGTPTLPSIDQAWLARQGGDHNKGYLFLDQTIPENSWFYSAHFHQDPVMPGSLGVETMAAAIRTTAPHWGIPANLDWHMAANTALSWKYRGQITPNIRQIGVDLHIKSIIKKGPSWEITADGQLWKGSKRIYLVENLCLESDPMPQENGR